MFKPKPKGEGTDNDSYAKNRRQSKEYNENAVKNVTDYYAKKRLKAEGFETEQLNQEIIEVKRLILKTNRL